MGLLDKGVKLVLRVMGIYAAFLVIKSFMTYEGFTYAGVMDQLDSTSTPTVGQELSAEEQQRRQIRHDLLQMTGSP